MNINDLGKNEFKSIFFFIFAFIAGNIYQAVIYSLTKRCLRLNKGELTKAYMNVVKDKPVPENIQEEYINAYYRIAEKGLLQNIPILEALENFMRNLPLILFFYLVITLADSACVPFFIFDTRCGLSIFLAIMTISTICLRCYYQEEVYRLVWESDYFLKTKITMKQYVNITPEQQTKIAQQTGWSYETIRYIRSIEEAMIYMKAGLVERNIGGRTALVRTDINWSDYSIRRNLWLKDGDQNNKLKDWDKWAEYNNADLIGEGYPPRDENGDPYELHHIGQHQDSPFAELTWEEHMGNGNNPILHPSHESEIYRDVFDKEKSAYWQARFKAFTKEELDKIYK